MKMNWIRKIKDKNPDLFIFGIVTAAWVFFSILWQLID